MDPDYLSDKVGPKDAEVERLESLLSDAKYKPKAARPSRLPIAVAAMAALLLVGIGLFLFIPRGPALSVKHADGRTSRLGEGRWLRTEDKTADVALKDIGTVRVGANSAVQLVSLKENEQRLQLVKGELHARVVAPPRLFIVETPATTAVDLGCEYVLKVTEAGDTELSVLSGAVALEGRGHPVFVPQGHGAVTRKSSGTGLPFRSAASGVFRDAVGAIDALGSEPVPQELLATLLRESTRYDAPTLFELFQRLPQSQKPVVAEQLAALIPPSTPGTLKRVLAGDEAALAQWWDDIYNAYDAP